MREQDLFTAFTKGAKAIAKLPTAMDLRAPSDDYVEAAVRALPNDWKAPYCSTHQDWITFGLALYGATGGERFDLWEAWDAPQPQQRDLAYVWDSFHDTTVGWPKLAWLVREHGPEDAFAGLAPLVFDDGAEAPEEIDAAVVEALQRDVANLIVEAYGDGIRYNVSTSLWHRFDQTWKESPHPLGYRLAKKWADHNATSLGKTARAAVSKSAFYEGVEKILRADEHLAVEKTDFDVDNWLLGTPGGTVDLRTGVLRAAVAGEMISLSTNVVPAAGEDCPKWLAFIDWACTDPSFGLVDGGMRRMLRQWAGYGLTGDVSKEMVVFLHGGGANGKGTFIETMQAVLGSYFYMATKDLFMEGRNGTHTEEIAALAGKRMVAADEVPTASKWNESLLKGVSGGGEMTTRHLYGRVFTFPLRFKLTISGNEKPTFQGTVNEALKRRLNLMEFRMTAKPVDDALKKVLAAEAPGVLRWAIGGLLDLLGSPGGKLFVADSVISATEEYFNENDLFGQWLRDCVEVRKGSDTSAADAFQSWHNYRGGADAANRSVNRANDFKVEMVKRGYVWARGRNFNVYKNIALKTPVEVF